MFCGSNLLFGQSKHSREKKKYRNCLEGGIKRESRSSNEFFPVFLRVAGGVVSGTRMVIESWYIEYVGMV